MMDTEDTWMLGQNSNAEKELGFECLACLRLTSTVAMIVTAQECFIAFYFPFNLG